MCYNWAFVIDISKIFA